MDNLKLTLKDVVTVATIILALAGNYFALRESIRVGQTEMQGAIREIQIVRENDEKINRLQIEALELRIKRLELEIDKIDME